jgi:CDP-glucose 4,6-dehydratase
MENLVKIDPSLWRGKSVFLTGHTGFKGAWLALWLHRLGAVVHGYALNPPTEPSLFSQARLEPLLASDTRADLADLEKLKRAMSAARPAVILHLAAQPLVRESYRDPAGTFATNVLGTAHVLEAARGLDSLRAIVVITTDKVYENREWSHPYRESDHLGGHDPYSASKAAAEIVVASYRASFFSGAGGGSCVPIATARAGNVIGGGDWARDRLVPDCLRAFHQGEPVRLRYPGAVRPWQHVLEPLSGYLLLAQALLGPAGLNFAKAWNFGPDTAGEATVEHVAQTIAGIVGGGAEVICEPTKDAPHEAGLLTLDSSAARAALKWRPVWPLTVALGKTVAWHQSFLAGRDLREVSLAQIAEYESIQA